MHNHHPVEHLPVMLDEALAALNLPENNNGIYVDATFGRGGHSAAILNQLGPTAKLLALDQDPDAIAAVPASLKIDQRFQCQHSTFAKLENIAHQNNIHGHVNGILFDLGVSSPQLDTPERGFSFMTAGPLDMRMDTTQGPSVARWLNEAREADISFVIKTYGEERFAKRIAHAIVEMRKTTPIQTTEQLVAIISNAIPFRDPHKHPATRTFQALRIFINNELDSLEKGLDAALEILTIGGRLVVISFHSLEDRIVKRFIKRHAEGRVLPKEIPMTEMNTHQRLKIIGKAVKPTAAEIARNPRARSAIMRIAEKLT